MGYATTHDIRVHRILEKVGLAGQKVKRMTITFDVTTSLIEVRADLYCTDGGLEEVSRQLEFVQPYTPPEETL